MITSENAFNAGYRKKPSVSVIPYLKAKEKRRVAAEKKAKEAAQDTSNTQHEETYAEAIHKIVNGEE